MQGFQQHCHLHNITKQWSSATLSATSERETSSKILHIQHDHLGNPACYSAMLPSNVVHWYPPAPYGPTQVMSPLMTAGQSLTTGQLFQGTEWRAPCPWNSSCTHKTHLPKKSPFTFTPSPHSWTLCNAHTHKCTPYSCGLWQSRVLTDIYTVYAYVQHFALKGKVQWVWNLIA